MPKSDIRTLKIKYDLTSGDPVLFDQFVIQYNAYVRTFYNAFVDNPELNRLSPGMIFRDFLSAES